MKARLLCGTVAFFAASALLFSCKSPPPPPPEIPFYTIQLSIKEDGEVYRGEAKQFSLVPIDKAAVLSAVPDDILEANLRLREMQNEEAPVSLESEDEGEEKSAQKEKAKDEEEIFLVDLPPYTLGAVGNAVVQDDETDEDETDAGGLGAFYSARVLPGAYWLYENEKDTHIVISVEEEESRAVISYCSSVNDLVEAVETERESQSLAFILEDKTFSSLGYNNLLQRTLSSAQQKISLDMTACIKANTLGYKAFYQCTSLVSLMLPSTVGAIEKDTFSFCTELLYLYIPKQVTTIEGGSFSSCTNLFYVDVSQENKSFVAEQGALFSTDKKTLIAWPSARDAVFVPPTVENVTEYAFSYCTNVKELSLEAVQSVGQYAFLGCTALSKITISPLVSVIERNAFASCPALKTIFVASENTHFKAQNGILYSADGHTLLAWPSASGDISVQDEQVLRIEDSAFENNQSIKTVVLPKSVREIGFKAFASCPLLTRADLTGVQRIEPFAFAQCPALSEVRLSPAVFSIEGSSFSGCTALARIVVPEENSVFSSEAGALFSKEKDVLFLWPGASGDIVLPESVQEIGSYAFHGDTLITSLTAPMVARIGNFSFAGCSHLLQADFGNALTEIGTYSFFKCNAIQELFIPEPVSVIKDAAFWFWRENQHILCAAASQPATWSAEWNAESDATVLWAQQKPQPEEAEEEP